MKANEIKVGGLYRAKVNNNIVTVRVDAIDIVDGFRISGHGRRGRPNRNVYRVTNLKTGRTTTFRSAAKFREVVSEPKKLSEVPAGVLKKTERDFLTDAGKLVDDTSSLDQQIAELERKLKEAEQRPDPTATTTGSENARPVADLDPASAPVEHKPGDPGFDPSIVKSLCRCPRCRAIRAGTFVGDEKAKYHQCQCETPEPRPQGKQVICLKCGGETKAVGRCNKWVSDNSPTGPTSERCRKPTGHGGPCGGFTVGDTVKGDEQSLPPTAPTVKIPASTRTIRRVKPTAVIAAAVSPGDSGQPTTEGRVEESDPTSAASAAAPAVSATTPIRPATGLGALLAKRGERNTAEVPQVVAGYTPTEEQRSVLEIAKRSGLKTLVISAGAGTGKTSTLKMVEEIIPGKGQYTAYNASLVNESKSKFSRAACNTTHSLAFRAVGKRYAKRLGGNRMRSEQMAASLGINDFSVKIGEKVNEDGSKTDIIKVLSAGFLAGQVKKAIDRFCQSADRQIAPQHFKYIDGIDVDEFGQKARLANAVNNTKVREYLMPFAEEAWKDLTDVEGKLPFSHDCYVKIWQLGVGPDRPVINAEYILLDEAQDTAPVMLDILKQQDHSLLIFVGDSNQQIYEWRGAVDAMKAFTGAPRRMLSQSFRFGQSIADVANSVLATLEEPSDLMLKGLPTIPSRVDRLTDPKCILCRTNACAVSAVLKANAVGKKVHLIGGGKEVVNFCKAARDLQNGRKTSHPDLCCFDSWSEVQAYVKEDEGEDLKLLVKLIDDFGVDEIIAALENMPPEEKADLVVSTAHKSKGREWDTVRLANDFNPPGKMSDSEKRLLYVAVTRAKYQLDIELCPAFSGGQTSDGIPLLGISVQYTTEMPSAEQLETFLREKEESKKSHVAPSDNGSSDKPTGNVNGTFTWSKNGEQWVVRGPAHCENVTVQVLRRSGPPASVRLGAVVQKYGEVWLYQPLR